MAAGRRPTGSLLLQQLAISLLLASCANAFSPSMTARPDQRSRHRSVSCDARPTPSRAEFLRGAALAGASVLLPLSPAAVGAEDSQEDSLEFKVEFSCSKGPLGIKLQEMRVPKGKESTFRVVISGVDPRGQGVKQDARVRPGLLVTSIQGRSTAGLSAKQVISELEDEILARIGPDGAQAAVAEGLSEKVEVTLSAACASAPGEPRVCYNSVMSLDSVLGAPRK